MWQMFAVMDFDQSGAIGFDEFWEFASLPDNVDLWNWMVPAPITVFQ